MAKDLMPFNEKALPAHIQRAIEAGEGNIEARASVPSLTYGGKKWTMVIDGDEKMMQKRNEDGDLEPATTINVIILDYAKRRGRTYYEGAYDKDKPGKPLCWSDDGITPHKSIAEPQGAKCADCPLSVKGSKTNDQGKAVVACSEHRMLAVVPANKPSFTPLRLKLAITSDYDGQSPDLVEKGWFAFSNYKDFLRANNVPSTYFLITKLRFDPNADWPKVIFHKGDWLDEDALKTAIEASKSDDVQKLLAGSWTPEGPDGHAAAEAAEAQKPKTATPKAKAKPVVDDDELEEKPAPKKKPAAVKEFDDDDGEGEVVKSKPFTEDDIELTTTSKAKQAEVAANQKAKKAAALDEDGDDVVIDDDAPAPKAKAKAAAPKAKAKAAEVEDDDDATAKKPGKPLIAVLSDWDDDE